MKDITIDFYSKSDNNSSEKDWIFEPRNNSLDEDQDLGERLSALPSCSTCSTISSINSAELREIQVYCKDQYTSPFSESWKNKS
jgi:hypothetical protein